MGNPLEPVDIHPLFPCEADDEDDEVKPVSSIHITRKENGKFVFAPRPRQASELQSIEQIASEFGGGEYQLIAYHNGRITTRRVIIIPGKPKPMFDEGLEPVVEQKVSPSTVVDPMAALMGQGGGGIMGLIMMMMQQMMQQQAAAQQSQTQMFIAMMQNNTATSQADKEAQRTELAANIERERQNSERTMTLMREMMSNRPSGSGDEFAKGVEFMRSFATMQIDTARAAAKDSGDDGLEKLLETGMQALQGFMALKTMSQDAAAAAAGASQVVG